ncbi:CubicO group peptidase (beta-lactamase class C family) [Paraburkholderia sp. BL18I3N2]|uniref:serine hydrolase domain-containing protein n=1 Tax=unclassified Paraburkholderia TaxID=2615204 RepID=UPI000D48E56C|nr:MULTISPECIES: serine hydrolase domain-containing protein [unclassified Paraburkholderia]PRX19198.1 CubicO group peptidase (beta-lactamase class C family) [Paraburkholderia sp. BL18I3N2]PRX89420.1 CubicO group peptidase (beta-lactamase class C family) [Paraburkholderia sp. BL25I1N1]
MTGLSLSRLQGVEEYVENLVATDIVPGIVTLVAHRGEVATVVVAGYQDEEGRKPMRRDSIFRIASMTKPVTAVAVLMLIEQGRLALTDPIERWLPEFGQPRVLRTPSAELDDTVATNRSITVLDLLSHRAGLGYSTTVPGPLGRALQAERFRTDTTSSLDQWLAALAALPLADQPGEHFRYGVSSDVLGVLVERVSSRPFAVFLRESIFEPLGMGDTGFFVPADKQSRFTTAYGVGVDGHRMVSDTPGLSVWNKVERFPGGGGGLVSTADNYLCFANLLLGRGRLGDVHLLSPRSVALMTCNWLTDPQRQGEVFGHNFFAGQGYGLGVSVVDDLPRQQQAVGFAQVGSYGWSGRFGTHWRNDPIEQTTLLYLTQLQSTELTVRLPARVAERVADAIDY